MVVQRCRLLVASLVPRLLPSFKQYRKVGWVSDFKHVSDFKVERKVYRKCMTEQRFTRRALEGNTFFAV